MLKYIMDIIKRFKNNKQSATISNNIRNDIDYVTHMPKRTKFKGVDIIPTDYDDSKITILLLEDFQPFIDVILLELDEVISMDNVNVLIANTQYGAFNALLALDKVKIDYAFCDITLGGMLFDGQSIKEYDGIDVFEKIMINNPKAKVKLLTGHNLQSEKLEITDAISKFDKISLELNLGLNISDVYINKRSARTNMYYDLVNDLGSEYDKIS